MGIVHKTLAGLFLCTTIISAAADDTADWIQQETVVACSAMLYNISPPGTEPGVVVASPSRENPNYFFHWVRDASLTMDVVVGLYRREADSDRKASYFQLLFDFWQFSLRNQTAGALTGLGEPKFNVDGSPFSGPWGRPQNDGPALRALAFLHWAQVLAAEGQFDLVRRLYVAELPAHSVIKADLEYVASQWHEPAFDLWEEIEGQHFYALMVQRRALIEGSSLAESLGDQTAAVWYREQARQINAVLERHWNGSRGLIEPTLNRIDGIDYKNSGIEAAILLGALHGELPGASFSPADDRVMASVHLLIERFQELYPINHNGAPGVALGRYPEDQYYGGNPWVLITAGAAQYHYRLARLLRAQRSLNVTPRNLLFLKSLLPPGALRNNLRPTRLLRSHQDSFQAILEALDQRGDAFMERIRQHAGSDGSLSEQIHRNTGFMESARDLTWNYASFLTAVWEKEFVRR